MLKLPHFGVRYFGFQLYIIELRNLRKFTSGDAQERQIVTTDLHNICTQVTDDCFLLLYFNDKSTIRGTGLKWFDWLDAEIDQSSQFN